MKGSPVSVSIYKFYQTIEGIQWIDNLLKKQPQ